MPVHDQQLACDGSAPRLAREWADRVLQGVTPPDGFWRDDIVQDILLCASELVNSSLIAQSTAIAMQLSAEPGVFRLSLIDDRPILSDSTDSRFRVQSMSFRVIEASSESSGITPVDGVGRELWVRFCASERDVPAPRALG